MKEFSMSICLSYYNGSQGSNSTLINKWSPEKIILEAENEFEDKKDIESITMSGWFSKKDFSEEDIYSITNIYPYEVKFYEDEREGEEGYNLTYFFYRRKFRERLVEKFKKENKGKYVWFHAMHEIGKALYWGDIASSYEEAVEELAAQEGVDKEEIVNDYDNIYYIIDIDEISDEDLLEYLDN